MSFRFETGGRRRGVPVLPFIDAACVSLLLVLFVPVAVSGRLPGAPGAAAPDAPLRVMVEPEGLRLNGEVHDARDLLVTLVGLTETGDERITIVAGEGVRAGRVMTVVEVMTRAGFRSVVLEAGG